MITLNNLKQDLAVTYTKAVGIMLMVLAHCTYYHFLYQVVYSFHMPLFFIVSGCCFKEKYFHEPITFVWRRIKGLWWPYVKWGMIFLLLHNFFFHLNIYNDQYGYNGIVQHLYNSEDVLNRGVCILMMTRNECLLGGYWFLSSLFWGSLIAFFTIFICHNMASFLKCKTLITTAVGGAILLVTCLITNYIPKTFTVFLIGPRDFMAATFFVIGYCFATCKFPKFNWWQSLIAFGIMVANSFYCLIGIASPFNDPTKVVPYTITAVLGTWCVYSLPWERVKGVCAQFLRYVGNHTLTILTWHFLCFKIVSLIIIFVYGLQIERLAEFPIIGEYTNRGWFVIYTIIGIGLPLLMTYLLDNVKRKNVNICLR